MIRLQSSRGNIYCSRGAESSGARWFLLTRMSQGPPGASGAHPVGALPAALTALCSQTTHTRGIITWTLLSGFLSVFRWRHPERAFRVNCHLKTFLQVNSLAYFGCLHLPLQLIYRLLDFTVRAFFVLSFCLFYLDKPFCLFVCFFTWGSLKWPSPL